MFSKFTVLISSIPFLRNNISAYGLDCFVFPMLAITNGISGGHAVIDASIGTHLRDIRSNKRIKTVAFRDEILTRARGAKGFSSINL